MSLRSIVGRGFEKELLDFKTAGVTTVADLIGRNTSTLKTLTSGSLKNVLNLRANLIHKVSPTPHSGLKLYNDMANSSQIVVTGIEELDEALDGGLYSGETTAIIRTNANKSTSSSMISGVNSKVIFIDTGDYFETNKFSNSPKLFTRTKVFDIMEYLEFLEYTRLNSRQCDLLVTDCFTDVIANLVGGIPNDDLVGYVKKAMRSLKTIAMQHNIAVLLHCRDVELSQRFMLSNLLHALVDSCLCIDGGSDVRLVLTKSSKHPCGKPVTLSAPK